MRAEITDPPEHLQVHVLEYVVWVQYGSKVRWNTTGKPPQHLAVDPRQQSLQGSTITGNGALNYRDSSIGHGPRQPWLA